MKTVLITGSTRGLGRGLAQAFLELGCAVVINGRRKADVDQVVQSLAQAHDPNCIGGYAGDMCDFEQVQALWEAAQKRFGRVDIWINNAGISHLLDDFWKLDPQVVRTVLETNLTGAMYGSLVALRGMLEQGYGALYNMEGLGSRDGRKIAGLSLYGSSKAGLSYFTQALAQETAGTPVLVGALSPGMVLTDMLTGRAGRDPQEVARAERVFSILADRVETVAPWLARRILANQRNGIRIAWLTPAKVMGRFLTAPFRRRRLLD
jgi:NAD(P)-dependent dehydrogenase (short-subunit alcohol dehydrogenase family)